MSALLIVKWSFRDKKRVETIISDFTKLNSSIHDYVKFVCLGSSIGVGLRHLQYLRDDGNSVELGFDVDAKLKLTVQEESETQVSLELPQTWVPQLLHLPPLAECFNISRQGKDSFCIEHRPCDTTEFNDPGVGSLATHRVNALARLLHQPKEPIFRIPRCIGWRHVEKHICVAFVFENPTPQCQSPISLNQLLRSDLEKPSLNSKFSVACILAKGIAQLHLVQWLHENVCSDNVLFFPDEEEHTAVVKSRNLMQHNEPWILGFESSRPEGELSYGPMELNPQRDIYRHPDRQGQVKVQFTKLHDIYSLGVVLLEIGLWSPAVSLQSKGFTTARNAQVVKEQLIKQAERRLASHLGSKYRDLVLKCLRGDFGVANDTKDDLKLRQAFRTQVVDVLKVAAESV